MGEMRPVLGLLLLVVGCGNGEGGRGKGNYDVLLRGGWSVDGSGNPGYRGDVAIAGDRIAGLGFLAGAQARETLDVSGLVVAPGFIDMMGQSEINVLIDNRVLSKVTQGVTTEVTGEGGSIAPLTDKLVRDDSDAMKKWHYREDWRDLDGYVTQLERHGSTVNIATFVGATQVRLAVIGRAPQVLTSPRTNIPTTGPRPRSMPRFTRGRKAAAWTRCWRGSGTRGRGRGCARRCSTPEGERRVSITKRAATPVC